MSDVTLLSLQIFSYAMSGALGFILGRLTSRAVIVDEKIEPKGTFFKPEVRQRKDVVLDERTFVTTISTESLTKKNGDIGTSTVVEDNVSASASKLAQLKKSR